jgi:hypothetical protein
MNKFLGVLGGFCLGIAATLSVIVAYNNHQIRNKVHMETRIKEYDLVKVELKSSSFQLTGEDEYGKIQIDVQEMPVDKKKFIVHLDSYMLPDGEFVRYRVFKGYK